MPRIDLPPRYTEASPVGAGSFATVFAATDVLLGRRVAVKILKRELADDADVRLRFAREVQAAALLGDHPDVVTVHDAGEWAGRPYLVMELLQSSVEDRLRERKPVARTLALRWLAQAAEALDFVHAHGVVHRDIKPSNLLLDTRGDLRLADFGVASLARGGGELTLPGQIVGTPAYLAPELARGMPATPASDRYSFALVARALLPDEPAIERGLADDPRARYGSAADLVAALGDGERTLVLALPQTAATALAATRAARAPQPTRHRVVRFRRAACIFALVAAASAALGAYASPRLERAIHYGVPAPTPRVETCAVSTLHHDANIVARGVSADAFCAAQPHVFELAGDAWGYRRSAALSNPDRGAGQLGLVCRLQNGQLRITVYDAGGQAIGRRVCGWYAAGGWSATSVT